jgi:VanZ family protein
MQNAAGKYASRFQRGEASRIFIAARLAAWCLGTAIVVLSVVPPDLRPETFAPHDLEHFVIYAITGCAFGIGYRQRLSLLAIWLVNFSGCVEVTQLFVPGRHARLGDFIVDAIASCVGLISGALLRRIVRGFQA